MITLEGPSVIFYDIDNTLVMWNGDATGAPICLLHCGKEIHLEIHIGHVNMLKANFEAGHKIICWSRQGSKWAEHVVQNLNLESFVDICISKPFAYVDDHPDFFNSKECLNQYLHGKFGE